MEEWSYLYMAEMSPKTVPHLVHSDPQACALALTFGLSLTHHRTTLLLAPFVLVFLAWQAPVGYGAPTGVAFCGWPYCHRRPCCCTLYVPLRVNATPYLTMEIQPGQLVSLLDRSPAGLINYVLAAASPASCKAYPLRWPRRPAC